MFASRKTLSTGLSSVLVIVLSVLCTGCIGPLVLEDFVVAERDETVSNDALLRLGTISAALPRSALEQRPLAPECATFAEDDDKLVTAGDRVRLWDIVSESPRLMAVAGDLATPYVCAVDRNRGQVALGTTTGVAVIDLAAGEVSQLPLPTPPMELTWSLDGSRLLAVVHSGIYVGKKSGWTSHTPALVESDGRRGLFGSVATSIRGVAVVDRGSGDVILAPLAGADDPVVGHLDGAVRLVRPAHVGVIRGLLWNYDADGAGPNEIIALTAERTVRWRAPWWQPRVEGSFGGFGMSGVRRVEGKSHSVRAKPDGIRVYEGDSESGNVTATIPVRPRVDALAFIDDAPNLIARTADGIVTTWDPTADVMLLDATSDEHPGGPMAMRRDARQAVYGPPGSHITLSDDGEHVAIADRDMVLVREISSAETHGQANMVPGYAAVDAIALSPNGDTIAVAWTHIVDEDSGSGEQRDHAADEGAGSGPPDHALDLYDIHSGDRIVRRAELGPVTALHWPERHDALLVGGASGELHALDSELEDVVSPLRIGGSITAIATARRRDTVAIGTHGGRIVLWELGGDASRIIGAAHRSPVTALAFSTYDDLVASGDAAGAIAIFSSHLLDGDQVAEKRQARRAVLDAVDTSEAADLPQEYVLRGLGERVAKRLGALFRRVAGDHIEAPGAPDADEAAEE